MSITAALPCDLLSPIAHLIFHQCCRRYRPGKSVPGKGDLLRTTVSNVSFELSIPEREVRELIVELVETQLVLWEGGRLYLLGDPCRCQIEQSSPRARSIEHAQGARSEVKIKNYKLSACSLVSSSSSTLSSSEDSAEGRTNGKADEESGWGRRAGDPQTWNARDLTSYLEEQVTLTWFGRNPGGINFGAVAKNIAQWINRDGISRLVVKRMIDLFVADPRNNPRGVPSWRIFLARRQPLFETASRQITDEQRSSTSADHWRDQPKKGWV